MYTTTKNIARAAFYDVQRLRARGRHEQDLPEPLQSALDTLKHMAAHNAFSDVIPTAGQIPSELVAFHPLTPKWASAWWSTQSKLNCELTPPTPWHGWMLPWSRRSVWFSSTKRPAPVDRRARIWHSGAGNERHPHWLENPRCCGLKSRRTLNRRKQGWTSWKVAWRWPPKNENDMLSGYAIRAWNILPTNSSTELEREHSFRSTQQRNGRDGILLESSHLYPVVCWSLHTCGSSCSYLRQKPSTKYALKHLARLSPHIAHLSQPFLAPVTYFGDRLRIIIGPKIHLFVPAPQKCTVWDRHTYLH